MILDYELLLDIGNNTVQFDYVLPRISISVNLPLPVLTCTYIHCRNIMCPFFFPSLIRIMYMCCV